MVKRIIPCCNVDTHSNKRLKKGFALFPVKAGNYKVWMQLYEVLQRKDPITKRWENIEFTTQTFSDWTKI